jgi:hypothetical protein
LVGLRGPDLSGTYLYNIAAVVLVEQTTGSTIIVKVQLPESHQCVIGALFSGARPLQKKVECHELKELKS